VAESSTQGLQGTVKWFSADKGYGFATVDRGPDVFVHYSVIETDGARELAEGQRVMFHVSPGAHGPMAQAVRPL
jgi:CspA family cold shock protein